MSSTNLREACQAESLCRMKATSHNNGVFPQDIQGQNKDMQEAVLFIWNH